MKPVKDPMDKAIFFLYIAMGFQVLLLVVRLGALAMHGRV